MLNQKSDLSLFGFLVFAFCLGGGIASAATQTCPLSPVASNTPYVKALKEMSEFQNLMRIRDGIPYVKYVFEITGEKNDYFQNSMKYDFHYPFLRAEIPAYKNLASMEYEKFLFGQPKVFSAGAIFYIGCKNHPVTKIPGYAGFSLYFKGQVELNEVASAYKRLSTSVTFSKQPLVFVFDTTEAYFKHNVALKQQGIPSIAYAAITDVTKGAVYHAAKSYGYLRPLKAEQFNAGEYTAKDILVLNQVSLDIGPAAGILTMNPQMPHSHMILRAINQNIPDAFVLEDQIKPYVAQYAGQLVELVTSVSGQVTIKGEDVLGPALRTNADAYFRQRIPVLPPLQKDLSVKEFLPLGPQTNVTAELVKAYGAKGTNFGLIDQALRKAKIDRSYFSGAFLVPFSFYDRHVSQKLTAPICEKTTKKCKEKFGERCVSASALCGSFVSTGSDLRSFLVQIGTAPLSEKLIQDPSERKMYLFYAQTLLKQAPLDAESKTKLTAQLMGPNHKKNQRMRFRSSTNAEDLPGFNGAGFYNSKSACLEDSDSSDDQGSACMSPLEKVRIQKNIDHLKSLDEVLYKDLIDELSSDLTEKKPLDKAVRGVFASLWNEKAFLYRDYYQIKHDDVYMGILVHPSFADETANGVAMVSQKSPTQMEFNVVTQVDDISITNPVLPKAEPEHFVVLKPKSGKTPPPTYVTHSNLTAAGTNVLNPKQILDLSRQLTIVWQTLGERLKGEKTIDVEFIGLAKGQIVIKQGRPLGEVSVNPNPTPIPVPTPVPVESGKGTFSFTYHNHQWNFINVALESGLKIQIGTPIGDDTKPQRNLTFGFRPILGYNQVILTQGNTLSLNLSVWPDSANGGDVARDIFCQNVTALATAPEVAYPFQMETVAGQFGLTAEAGFQDCGMFVQNPTSSERFFPRDLVCMFSPQKTLHKGPNLVVMHVPWAKGPSQFPFLDEWPQKKISLCIDGQKYSLDQTAP